MARRRKNTVQESKTITLDVQGGGDLQIRLKKISKQTGLSNSDLLQKWILQEEFMIGLMSSAKKQAVPQAAAKQKSVGTVRRKTSVVKAEKEAAEDKPQNFEYRTELVARVNNLKKEGFTLKKIADTFNSENVATISGAGKWYTSSITWLLNSTK